jgi:hypothetical protein
VSLFCSRDLFRHFDNSVYRKWFLFVIKVSTSFSISAWGLLVLSRRIVLPQILKPLAFHTTFAFRNTADWYQTIFWVVKFYVQCWSNRLLIFFHNVWYSMCGVCVYYFVSFISFRKELSE